MNQMHWITSLYLIFIKIYPLNMAEWNTMNYIIKLDFYEI